MTHAARRLLPIAFALLALAAMAPGTAAAGPSTAAFPNQSLGNRGADVRAIQGLLRAHGSTIAVDGIFGATTRDAVKAFQTTKGLSATGIVRDTTWAKLIVGLHPGATGEAVKVVQRELNEKRRAGLTVNGVFGTATRNAVIAFQRHVGMTPHGERRRGDLAEADLALRLPVVQRLGQPVRLQRRQRQGELGDRRRDRPARGGVEGLRGDPPGPGLRRRRQLRARRQHPASTRPTRSASTSTSARSATRRTSARGARTGGSRRTTGPPPGP